MAQVYITNAVKHFYSRPRGKRRIHKTPLQRHVAACHDWLARELAQVERIETSRARLRATLLAGLKRAARIGRSDG